MEVGLAVGAVSFADEGVKTGVAAGLAAGVTAGEGAPKGEIGVAGEGIGVAGV